MLIHLRSYVFSFGTATCSYRFKLRWWKPTLILIIILKSGKKRLIRITTRFLCRLCRLLWRICRFMDCLLRRLSRSYLLRRINRCNDYLLRRLEGVMNCFFLVGLLWILSYCCSRCALCSNLFAYHPFWLEFLKVERSLTLLAFRIYQKFFHAYALVNS